ncbi:MAG TPA: hypothetical protein PKE32_03075 [Miltoncostaeaceae bacterium]|nr:hypothetical protein [Miltoncostaeaceae bacterium]
MNTPPQRLGEPSVYARLARQADLRLRTLTPPRGTRAVGRLVCLLIGALVVWTAARVPWR